MNAYGNAFQAVPTTLWSLWGWDVCVTVEYRRSWPIRALHRGLRTASCIIIFPTADELQPTWDKPTLGQGAAEGGWKDDGVSSFPSLINKGLTLCIGRDWWESRIVLCFSSIAPGRLLTKGILTSRINKAIVLTGEWERIGRANQSGSH